MKATAKQIAEVDLDSSRSIGTEDDRVYFEAALGPDGWYVSTIVDCGTAHFVDLVITDAGPFGTEGDALSAGLQHAVNWLTDSDIRRGWKTECLKLAKEFKRLSAAEKARRPGKGPENAPSNALGPSAAVLDGPAADSRPPRRRRKGEALQMVVHGQGAFEAAHAADPLTGEPRPAADRLTTEQAVADLDARILAEVAEAKRRIARKRRKEV